MQTLLNLRFWWKFPEVGGVSELSQISRQIKHKLQPFQPETGNILRTMGLLKRFPGCKRRPATSLIHRIQPRISSRTNTNNFVSNYSEPKQVNFHNLINIQFNTSDTTTTTVENTLQRLPTIASFNSVFAVPKFLFTDICSLTKTKSSVRAPVALETEMHLKPDISDAVVNINIYTIYRRDRNWSANDLRIKGVMIGVTRNMLDPANGCKTIY